jgi:hypothetical protein
VIQVPILLKTFHTFGVIPNHSITLNNTTLFLLKKYSGTLALLFIFSIASVAQKKDSVKHCFFKFIKNGSYYGSWGYNEESYTHSNLYVVQPSIGNNLEFNNITAHDHIGWNNVTHVQPTIPQYNYRLGYFFNQNQDWGVELNFDHTKYVVTQSYYVLVTGQLGGKPINKQVWISDSTLRYQLNNGANFFCFNLVKRLRIFSTHDKKFMVDGLLKAGFGPVIPHVDNTIFGNNNKNQFQFGGGNVGMEATVKVTFFKHVYLEYCTKLDYAMYYRLEVYDGRAHQSFGTYESILNIGYTMHINVKSKMAPAPL